MAETPELDDLLLQLDAFILGKVSVALPATIVDYDHARQVATVKPTVSARRQDPESLALIPEALPTIGNVPVLFPSSTGFAWTFPLLPGDPVLLVFCDRSIDEWKATGAPENVPQDIRRFDLTDAVALVGLRPFTRPIPASGWAAGAMVIEAPDLRLGSSAAVHPVALQPALLVELARISAAIATLGGVYTPGALPLPAAVADPTLCASLKVKAE